MSEQSVTVGQSVDAAFKRWAALTDAYALQLSAMQRGDASARVEALRLAREVEKFWQGAPAGLVDGLPA